MTNVDFGIINHINNGAIVQTLSIFSTLDKVGTPSLLWIGSSPSFPFPARVLLELKDSPVNTARFALLLDRIADNTLSGKTAKQVFTALWEQQGEVDEIIEAKGLKQITDTGAIEAIVDEVIADCPDQVQQFRDGNDKVIGFLVGQVMQRSKGKANPQMANQMLKDKMNS